jgi:NADH-quinone oxidoreductase subunit N
LLLGTGLVLVGFAFKVAAVPFHMWAPDVYEGAPTPVTAFMVTAVKAAAVGTFLRVCAVGLPPLVAEVGPVLWGLAALTMLVGNLVALTQTNAKRMLAYSSIAHAGTMLVGLYVLREDASAAVLYYLVAYSFASVGAFAVMSFFETKEGRGLTFDEYAGLASRYPLVCAAMAVFMLSLIGVPLTAGFMGKFYIFRSAIRAGAYWLAGIGILSSLVSLYYYLRMVGRMYMGTPLVTAASDPVERTSPRLTVALALALAGTLWYGFGPQVGLGVEDLWMAARQAQRVVQAEGAAGAQTSLPTSGPGVRPSSASGAAPSR